MSFDFRPVFQRALPYNEFLKKHGTADNRTRWQQVYDAVSLTKEQVELLGSFQRKMSVLCMAGAWCGDCVNACPIFQRFAEHSLMIDLRFVNRERDFEAAFRAANGTLSKATKTDSAAMPEAAAAQAPAKNGTTEDPEDIRSRPIGKILVKWGILTPERVEKALLVQEEKKAKGLNVKIGDVLTDMGLITSDQRDNALAAQSGYQDFAAWDVAVAKELWLCGGPRVPSIVFLSEDGYECGRFGDRTLVTYREKVRKRLQGASCPSGLMPPEQDILRANVAEWLGYFERIQWMLLTSPRLMKLHGEA